MAPPEAVCGPRRRSRVPVVEFLKIPESGDPYLEGQKCQAAAPSSSASATTARSAARAAASRRSSSSNRGKLYVYSIVHRSFPGIEVPYVSAIVDLEGGGTVKGNLINIEPDPEKIRIGMPVEVVYKVAPAQGQRRQRVPLLLLPAPAAMSGDPP